MIKQVFTAFPPGAAAGPARFLGQAAMGEQVELPTPNGATVRVRVPAGSTDGKTLRVKGRGAPRLNETGTGDLLASVVVAVPSHLTPAAKDALEAFAAAMPDENPREDLLARGARR